MSLRGFIFLVTSIFLTWGKVFQGHHHMYSYDCISIVLYLWKAEQNCPTDYGFQLNWNCLLWQGDAKMVAGLGSRNSKSHNIFRKQFDLYSNSSVFKPVFLNRLNLIWTWYLDFETPLLYQYCTLVVRCHRY